MISLYELAEFAGDQLRDVVVTVVPGDGVAETNGIKAWAIDSLRYLDQHRNSAAMDDVSVAFGVGCRTGYRNVDGSVSRVFYPKSAAYVVGAAAERVGFDPSEYIKKMVEEAQ